MAAVVQKKPLQFSAINCAVTFEHKHEDKSCSACRERECVRVRECESERVTFEPRHENKSCSACRERE